MASFYPVGSSRATTQSSITSMMYQINRDQLAIQDLQTQISTGRRLASPSQDPAAAIRGLAAQRQLEYKSQVDDNLSSADTILSATESTLSQSQSILNEMRGVAVAAGGNTLSTEEKDAYIAQITAAISKLTELGNAKFRDQYIFAGSDLLAPPLQQVGDSVRFSGNTEALRTISDYASTISANVTAGDAFGVTSSKVVSTVDLDPALTSDTALSLLNRGEGIRGGAISFSNGVNSVVIDLADTHNLSDVMEKINGTQVGTPTGTRTLTATLTAQGLNIAYQDGLGGLLRIDEVGSGHMAADLGINNSQSAGTSPVTGKDLNPIVTNATRLSQLFGGIGINIGDSFQIKQGSKTYGITTNNISTVEDLINRIQSSGAQVQTSLDPSGRFLQLQSTESGTAMSIGETGSNLASKLGLRTFDLRTPVSDLNFGQGIFSQSQGDDLVFTRSDGSEMKVNLDGVQTVQDVLNRINNNVDNFNPALRITAALANVGNGITLSAASGTQPIAVKNAGGSQAAWGLGLVSKTTEKATGVATGSLSVITGADVSGVEVEGVFTSLIRMRQSLASDQNLDLGRVTAALDLDLQRMSLSRGLIGTRQQSIEHVRDLSAEQQVQLKQIESDQLDADLASVISDMTARQAALQASLQLMGNISKLTLFNYI